MTTVTEAVLAAEALSVDRALSSVASPDTGGVALFVGLVRRVNDGELVTSLDYTAHPGAARELTSCATDVAARHDVLAVCVQHRIGHLEIGDIAVIVAVGAVHRAPALECCRELIDEVKRLVPIWKEEQLVNGGTVWVGS